MCYIDVAQNQQKGDETLIRLNMEAFARLQGEKSETEMASLMKISRTQLWRAKKGGNVGEAFISKAIKTFPEAKFGELFVSESKTEVS